MDHDATLGMVAGKLGKFGFDPTIILVIVEAIVNVIKACPHPPAPTAIRGGKSGLFQQLQLRRSLRASGLGPRDLSRAEEAVWKIGAETTEDEAKDFLCCCDCCC